MKQLHNSFNKKIALYIPSMQGGGAERVMLTLANGLAEKGIEVDLVLNKAQGPYLKDLSSNVNIVELKASRAIKSIIPLARYIRKHRPDTILSAMNYINIITLVSKTLSLTNTKVIISEHAHLSASLAQMNGLLMPNIFKTLMKLSYSHSDAIVAVSKNVADDLSIQLGIPPENITTIYNPIVSPNLSNKSKELIKYPVPTSFTGKVIISVGRLVDEKNFPMLIRAFNEVQKEIDSRLIILGEGYAESQLRDLAKQLNLEDKVIFAGFVDNPYAWMRKADLFVLTSNHEGFGNVIVEAMACSTPVISTNCPGGPYEILEGGKWGDLVPVGNEKDLSQAIFKSLNNKDRISPDDLKKRAYEFSVENSLNKYLNILI